MSRSQWCLGGVAVVSRWCLGGVSLASWSCLCGVSLVSCWRLGGVSVEFRWCRLHLGGAFVVSQMVPVVPSRFWGGALVAYQWCLGGVSVVSCGCVCGVLRCLRDVLAVS